MTPIEATQILETLAGGIDPISGEVLGQQSPFNEPQVIRALYYAVRELKRRQKPQRSAPSPDNAGKPWTKEEDDSLTEAFDAGMPIKELARKHARTKGSIQSRLMRHGRLPVRTNA